MNYNYLFVNSILNYRVRKFKSLKLLNITEPKYGEIEKFYVIKKALK